MRRVSKHSRCEGPAVGVMLGECGAEMVLNIARVCEVAHHALWGLIGGELALELVKDLLKRLSHDIAEHVHAASVRHTYHNLGDT